MTSPAGLLAAAYHRLLRREGIRRRGEQRRKAPRRRIDLTVLDAQLQAGHTLARAAAAAGCSTTTAHFRRRALGLAPRGTTSYQPDTLEACRDLFRQGKTIPEVAEALKVSHRTARMARHTLLAKWQRLGPDGAPYQHPLTDEIRRLICDERKTLLEIGTRFGLTRERIRQIAVKAGITVRTGRPPHICTAVCASALVGGARPEGVSRAQWVYARRQHPEVRSRRRHSSDLATCRPLCREVVALYAEHGMSTPAIGAVFGLRAGSIMAILVKHGVAIRSRRDGAMLAWGGVHTAPWQDCTYEHCREICQAYLAGRSRHAIARDLKISPGSVLVRLRRHGLIAASVLPEPSHIRDIPHTEPHADCGHGRCAEIAGRYPAETLATLAARAGVKAQTVRRWLRDHGVPMAQRRRPV
jgi:DNA-binding CsgD family transcriptional regulator